MGLKKFNVSGMTCAACSSHVEKAVKSVEGVKEVSVSLLTNSMTVDFSAPAGVESICSAVAAAGYGASLESGTSKSPSSPASADSLEDRETPLLAKRLIASLLLLIPMMYVSMGHIMWSWPIPSFMAKPLVIALYELLLTIAVMVINQRFFISGFKSLMHGAPNMDTLVALGSGSAFIYSTAVLFGMCSAEASELHSYLHEFYFESAAMILTLITVGKMLEAHSKGKTTDAIRGLMELAPKTAHVIRSGEEQTIPAEEVLPGDIFVVRPGESFPVDGRVIEGESAVNEAALTGESIPVDKSAGAAVSAATINMNGFLTCEATRTGSDTTLSRIIEMVENAAAGKAPISKVADRVSGIFVPTVIGISAVTLIIWLIIGKSFGYALARAISVLVISCPCALGLATPVAIMVGSGMGARKGILFKTAASLEAAGKTAIAVFDKTGTITEGKPAVTDICPADGITKEELIGLAASLETGSEHPLAFAILEKAAELGIKAESCTDFSALPGHGVRGTIKGRAAFGGNAASFSEKGIITAKQKALGDAFSAEGKTPLYFALEGRLCGIIAVADTIRADSAEAIREFKSMGIQTVMLTGDNRKTANAIAEKAGIGYVISDVLPDDKEAAVRRLSEYGKVAMVGDGINDAPALTRADLGIAIGAGSDIAIDAADLVLMKSSLRDAAAAIRLSKQVLRNIHQNLFWAFCYNCIGIPLAAGALIPFGIELNPMFGAAAMSLSSFCVVTNALRLNLFNIYSPGKASGKNAIQLPSLGSDSEDNNNTAAEPEIQEEITMTKTLIVEGMMCSHCTGRVQKALEALEGVTAVQVELEAKKATVTLSGEVSDKTLTDAVTAAGYEVTGCSAD